MAKCFKCGKESKNLYKFKGNLYGYSCYKKELILFYAITATQKAVLENAKIEILVNLKDNSFFNSCKEFFINNNFLSEAQKKALFKSLDDEELFLYDLIVFDILKEDAGNIKRASNVILKKYFNNELLKNYLVEKKLYIVEYKDIDELESIVEILDAARLEKIEKDEFLEIIRRG